jgi:CubicO group peptidase (beta-lactamase class C family)
VALMNQETTLTPIGKIPSLVATPLVVLAFGCRTSELPTAPDATPATTATTARVVGFSWLTATPESQGMCGSVRQLGCTKSLLDIWNDISAPKHNTKRFIVIRNDKVIYDEGGTLAYSAYSASKGLLGAPTLVYAMNRCGVGLTDRASQWLAHGDGARWATGYPWTDITVEHLATHTSGVCDNGNPSSACGNENPGWQAAFEKARDGKNDVYPGDAFTIARAKAEQNAEPALAPGSTFEYSNVGHVLLNYVVQKACGQRLADIYDLYLKRSGMGSPVSPALIETDGAQQFNQSAGIARWDGRDGAAVLRLAGRLGLWDNRNIEPVRYWHAVTTISGIPAAAAVGRGVVYSNNSTNRWTLSEGHRRLSLETFGHNGNHSTVFMNDPLTSTIIVRQGEENGPGASYLTENGCAPGWTGTAPTCAAGTDWSNNWNVSESSQDSPEVGPRVKIFEPLQEAFFFPPPFCRMVSAAGKAVDRTTDVYDVPSNATTIDLAAEIEIDPREGAGSSVVDQVEFYKESDGAAPEHIGNGTLVAGSSPARYTLTYSTASHGVMGEVRTYFASCVARSVQDVTKKVPSYSRPVLVRRLGGWRAFDVLVNSSFSPE